MGVVPPKDGFLEGLRTLCDEHKALLIFDEVITGFRLKFGGAAEYFGVTPDLVTYGKIIGAGMPVGAYGGRKEIMEMVSPAGPVYQAGTLSGNPVAMAAGLAQLKLLWEDQDVYTRIYRKGEYLFEGIQKILKENEVPYQVNYTASLGCIFFTSEKVTDYTSAKTAVDESMKTNDSQPEFILNRIHEIMKENNIENNRKVGLYGLTYKENVDDYRESPTLQMLELQEHHLARPLKCYDPFLVGNKIAENQYDDFDEFLVDIDMVVIMVKHDHIKGNWNKLKGKVILDCFNICPLEGVYHI